MDRREKFKEPVPPLIHFEPADQCYCAQVWSQHGWILVFNRALNDWEIEEVAKLLGVLNIFQGVPLRSDKPVWKVHSKGVYTVKSNYRKMNPTLSLTEKWPWKLIWKIDRPLKLSCFAWLAIRKACLTHEILQKKGMQICSRCFMCENEVEINSHLFIHCHKAANLWNMFLSIMGVNWVMPKSTMELLSNWTGIGSRCRKDNGGRSYQLPFGGPYGRQEMLGV